MTERLVRVAVAAPLYAQFDYLAVSLPSIAPGSRVRVPFGRGRVIGVVTAVDVDSDCAREKLKPIAALLDPEPLLPTAHLAFLEWVAAYYHHPPGEVVASALPARLRRSEQALPIGEHGWRLTASGRQQAAAGVGRAPRQAEVLHWLAARPDGAAPKSALNTALPQVSSAVLRALRDKQWLVEVELPAPADRPSLDVEGLPLNRAQRAALAHVAAQSGRFDVALLDGVTGSGKTEVYLQLAVSVLAQGRSVLILVPEISLTPQLFERFRARLGDTVRVQHSGVSDTVREQVWQRLRLGLSRVLLGTRSAIFNPMPDLGLVIVDEEHDPSFKQTEGLRYSARDLAIVRAQRAGCPVLLGSATPSLESLRNVELGRYRHLCLDERAGGAVSPRIDLLDIRAQPLRSGLSEPLLARCSAALDAGEQVMLFLNRRGYAPVLACFSCGWLSDCPHCDARQTLHRASGLLWCHHCGAQRRVPARCPACDDGDLQPLGQGTEQLEGYLAERFAGLPLIRIDRDATARKGGLERQLARLHEPGPALLIGTQMLAKGHHFPRVTLVGVVDADGGLFSADFRATERMAQLLVQVAGRAGRGERPGHVLIQTRYPAHPLLQTLVRDGYRAFAREALAERAAAAMPPYSHQALLRADARRMPDAERLLDAIAAWAARANARDVEIWGPVPAPMARRAGRHRAHLLLQSARRDALHALLDALPAYVAGLAQARGVRWSLDVDPIDLY